LLFSSTFFRLTVQPAASKELLGSIESEILSVFPADKIITPDSVRTALNLAPTADLTKTLLQAPTPTTCPWPDLETLRGKVMFGLIFSDQPTADMYKSLHPNQKGAISWMVWDGFYIPEAIMYTAGGGLDLSLAGGVAPPNMPKNASAIVANLAKDISDKAQNGYLVRGRADADTVEARLGYVGRAAAVLNSSATIVATDYAMPSSSVLPGINYSVKLYGNQPARCVNNAALGTYNGAEVYCQPLTGPTAVPLAATSSVPTAVADDSTDTSTVVDGAGGSVAAASDSPLSPTVEKSDSPLVGPADSGSSGSSDSSAVSPSPPTNLVSSARIVARIPSLVILVATAFALLLLC
jgi:hypothetical protein